MSTAEVVNEYLRRLDERDADGVGELFAEEIDWYVPCGGATRERLAKSAVCAAGRPATKGAGVKSPVALVARRREAGGPGQTPALLRTRYSATRLAALVRRPDAWAPWVKGGPRCVRAGSWAPRISPQGIVAMSFPVAFGLEKHEQRRPRRLERS
jgi:hypothetical protein